MVPLSDCRHCHYNPNGREIDVKEVEILLSGYLIVVSRHIFECL